MRTVSPLIKTAILLLVFFFATLSLAQEQTTSPQSAIPASAVAPAGQQKVFVFVQRTDRHAKYSKPEVFHGVLDDLMGYLKTKNVAIAVDEFGGRSYAEGATPLDTIFTIAHDSKANSVMYVVVDRPKTKWLKITVQTFDLNRKELWKEEVSSGGGMSGSHGFEVCTKKIREQLDKHVGQDGLPVLAASKEPVAEKP
jgi:hypothetical protein